MFALLLMQLAGMRGFEWIIIIALIAVVFFGAKKIPELARSFGRATGEFEKAKMKMRKEVERTRSTEMGGRQKLESVAETLGIDCVDKTDEELRADIARIIEKKQE